MNRRLLALALMLVTGILFLSGCDQPSGDQGTATFTPPTTHMTELRVGDTYTLSLDANGATENQWQVEFDTAFLELGERTYTPNTDAAGANGKEVFTFHALKPGVTEAYFSYTRHDEVIVNFTIGVSPDETMALDEALDIAQRSVCVEVGTLSENATLNDWTGTWWIDLNADKDGCAPACVVDIADQTAEVNWRCTGGLPAEEQDTETDVSLAPDPARARDAALTYLREYYSELAPAADLTWSEENMTEQGLVGVTTFRYTAESWVVVVSFPLVNPANTIYQVEVSNPDAGLLWQGDVDATGTVTETRALDGSQPVVCWGGFIKSLPAGGQWDDYLALEGDNGVGIEAIDNTVAAQIQVARDSETFVHVWGTLHCPSLDYGGCQLMVTRLHENEPGPLPDPEPVEGWTGIVTSLESGAQHDDVFTLMGDMPVQFGIGSTVPELEAQVAELRDTGEIARIWGTVACGVLGVNGAHIEVTGIERVGAP